MSTITLRIILANRENQDLPRLHLRPWARSTARSAECSSFVPCTPWRGGQLLAVGHAELVHGPVQVGFHGPHRQDQPVGDLGVGQAAGGEVDELAFSCGERGGAGFQSLDDRNDPALAAVGQRAAARRAASWRPAAR